jgi:hypothetical protein
MRQRLAAKMADPEYKAKRIANLRAKKAAQWADPAYAAQQSKLLKVLAKKHAVTIRLALRDRWNNPEYRAKAGAILTKRQQSPEMRALKREAYFRNQEKIKNHSKAFQDERRGFAIPPEKYDEYMFLRKRKKIKAAEVGRMLGLI